MYDAGLEDLLLGFSRSTGIYDLMNTPWGWPIIESVHFTGMCLVFGTIVFFDLRVLGLFRGVPVQALHRLVPFGVGGYVVNVLTGTMFVTSAPDQYLYNPAFQLKLCAMAVAGLNVLGFYRFCYRDMQAESRSAMDRARWFTLVSLVCWCMVVICGRLITFYRPPFNWCFWCS